MKFCLSTLLLILFLASCAEIIPAHDSGPPPDLYSLIRPTPSLSIAQKNALTKEVKGAIDANPGLDPRIYDAIAQSSRSDAHKNRIMGALKEYLTLSLAKKESDIVSSAIEQNARDAAIAKAVSKHGGLSDGLAQSIIAQANAAHPIPLVLTSNDFFKLHRKAYQAVASAAGLKIEDKNAILGAIKKAIDAHTSDQAARDGAIKTAVLTNGGTSKLANELLRLIKPISHLKSFDKSGLKLLIDNAAQAKIIYDSIIAPAARAEHHKNAILAGIIEAIKGSHANLENSIRMVIGANGGADPGYEQGIIDVVRAGLPAQNILLDKPADWDSKKDPMRFGPRQNAVWSDPIFIDVDWLKLGNLQEFGQEMGRCDAIKAAYQRKARALQYLHPDKGCSQDIWPAGIATDQADRDYCEKVRDVRYKLANECFSKPPVS